jgi:hypothetical protein
MTDEVAWGAGEKSLEVKARKRGSRFPYSPSQQPNQILWSYSIQQNP